MRFSLLILILFFLSNFAHAKKDTIPSGKWSYELQFSPNFSYRFLYNSDGEKWHVKERNKTEIPRIGFSVKFRVIYNISERWKLGLGLSYSNIGFNKKATQLTWSTPNDNFPTEIRSSSRYKYENLSLLTYYKLHKDEERNIELILGSSLSVFPNKVVVSKIKTNGNWTSSPNAGFIYNEVHLFGIVGISKSYKLSNKLLLKTNVTFNQAVLPTNSTSITKEYLNYLDINLGLNYRFH